MADESIPEMAKGDMSEYSSSFAAEKGRSRGVRDEHHGRADIRRSRQQQLEDHEFSVKGLAEELKAIADTTQSSSLIRNGRNHWTDIFAVAGGLRNRNWFTDIGFERIRVFRHGSTSSCQEGNRTLMALKNTSPNRRAKARRCSRRRRSTWISTVINWNRKIVSVEE